MPPTPAPRSTCFRLFLLPLLLLGAAAQGLGFAAEPAALKSESFDQSIGWEGFRSVLRPEKPAKVTQGFGWSSTSHASESPGEIGGTVTRSTTPAYYARQISGRSLKDRLTASGTFALTRSEGASGVFFGWFHARQQGFRPVNFLGFRLDGERTHATVHVDYTTGTWKAGGLNTRLQVLPDGKRHSWTLSYDPAAASGAGAIAFSLDGGTPQVLELAPGHQAEGARFDRFGIFNQQTPGGPLVAYFGNLELDGKRVSLAKDPKWESLGSQRTFDDYDLDDAQNFGALPTRFAGGGGAGEVGGTLWRTEPESPAFGYFADRIYRLTMNEPLFASGKVAMTRAASDSGMYFGWFNSTAFKNAPMTRDEVQPPGFLGIMIEGPSRVGHYVRPVYNTSAGSRRIAEEGPLIRPDGKSHTFTVAYDPAAEGGNGSIRLTFDGTPVDLKLPPGHKAEGAQFDRFGLVTMRRGGHYLTVFFDDLKYSAGK